MTQSWLPLAGALVVCLGALPVQAAPLSNVTDGAGAAANEETGTTLVHGRCYRHHGHWHCPLQVRRYYRYYDAPHYSYYRDPYPYYYGGPRFHGGYGPTFGIYFGGRRGWGGHWW
jgi:hypothetical protein